MKPTKFLYFLTVMVLPLLASCDAGSGTDHSQRTCDTIPLKYATNLTMVDYGNYLKADFRNPWDTTKVLQTFLLVPIDEELPSDLPKGTVVRTPLQKAIVYTTIHNSLIEELGAVDAIKGVCDAKYIYNPIVKERIANEQITDCGNSTSPNLEKILMLNPDAILLSAFENSNDHNKVAQVGVPIIDCTDYMETSPLGRAEWMKFYGRLFGKAEVADSLFTATEKAYNEVKQKVAGVKERPLVLTELIYGQSWAIPGAKSTIGVLIEDAGGTNPFESYQKSGSVQLAPEEVLFKAKDADFWLLKYSESQPHTFKQLRKANPIYTKFKAYQYGNVYGCNTESTSYFEDSAFHPHWLLAEFASIFHPELGELGDGKKYYHKLEP